MMSSWIGFSNSPPFIQGGIFFALLLLASIFDIRKRIIPDTICLFIAFTGLIYFEPVKLFGILATLPLLIVALVWGGMGGGDIKLMAASGIVLGFTESIAAMVIGFTTMLLFHVFYVMAQRLRGRDAPKAYPLAPFLSLGCLAAYFIF